MFLKRFMHQARFNPAPIAILVNPLFILRRNLYRQLRICAPNLQGDILDFGAGVAPYRHLFVRASKYVTVDIAASGHPDDERNADYYYDGRVLPFKDGEFDVVFSSEVFEHIFNLDEILSEIARVLKSQGKILVTIPFAWPEHEVPYDFARYSSYGIKSIFERHGFEVEFLTKSGGYIETVAQLLSAYFVQIPLVRKHFFLRALMTLIVASPINVAGILLERILPRSNILFLNVVVLAEKVIVS